MPRRQNSMRSSTPDAPLARDAEPGDQQGAGEALEAVDRPPVSTFGSRVEDLRTVGRDASPAGVEEAVGERGQARAIPLAERRGADHKFPSSLNGVFVDGANRGLNRPLSEISNLKETFQDKLPSIIVFGYDRFVMQPGPLIAEYARQAAVEPARFGDAIAALLTPDRALPVPPASDRATWDPSVGAIDPATIEGCCESPNRNVAPRGRCRSRATPPACTATETATPGNRRPSRDSIASAAQPSPRR